MDTEQLILDVVAATRSKSQKGDVSQALYEQGFFDNGSVPKGLKTRDENVTGNPVDVDKGFLYE